ncbi:major facilitator superfamily domain-containing protein [Achaetomium macrosporum]|uniref:Major facilitator superfamily domain-containing protein n=1 Tax=Achaetomium macrosporum TaxID=79813 RepID=A0AAN7C6P5_9PEZI|nr:major facilitator superfamily domain-containing protein [Achaetomium macrosporum]
MYVYLTGAQMTQPMNRPLAAEHQHTAPFSDPRDLNCTAPTIKRIPDTISRHKQPALRPSHSRSRPLVQMPESPRWNAVRRAWNWKPRPARYDPEKPPEFTVWLNILFAFASCFTVSNLYYNQAILNRIAETFDVTFEKASSVATLMQAGYAGGLLLICPLGDIFPRRPFILALVGFTATVWLALCLTTSFPLFSAISFLTGFTTVTPQLMLPLVGDLAPPHRRASCLAIVVSGLSLGVLVARILAGVIAAYTADWRGSYWFGLGVQWLVLGLLYVFLPDYPSKNPGGGEEKLNYVGIFVSIGGLLVTEPLLLQAALVAFLLSAVFTSYWTTLSFLLSSPPYEYSSMVVGLFGLIGVVVILAAPVYSRLVIDKVVPLASAVASLTVELVGVIVGTFTGSFHVAGPVVQAIAIDLGFQFTQIANRSAIYSIQPKARNRVNTAYMVMSFSGQLTGTAVGNRLYAQGGWVYSGSCSIAFIGLAIIISLARGPRETGWIGWSGGWAIRRDDLSPPEKPEKGSDTEADGESVQTEAAAGIENEDKGSTEAR